MTCEQAGGRAHQRKLRLRRPAAQGFGCRQDQLHARGAAADHAQPKTCSGAGRVQHPRPGGEEGGQGLDRQQAVRTECVERCGVGLAADVERQQVVVEPVAEGVPRGAVAGVAVRDPQPSLVGIERRRRADQQAHAGGCSERAQVDAAVVLAVMSGHPARQHARVVLPGRRRDQHGFDAPRPRAGERAQHGELGVAAAEEDESLHRHALILMACRGTASM